MLSIISNFQLKFVSFDFLLLEIFFELEKLWAVEHRPWNSSQLNHENERLSFSGTAVSTILAF